MARIIVKPVLEVQKVAQALAKGDLSQNITYRSKDEVGQMAMAVNTAVLNLRKLVGQVIETAQQVSSSSEELSSSAQEVGQATGQVADTINQLAKAADQQAKDSQEMSETVVSMTESVNKVSSASGRMEYDAKRTTSATDRGRSLVTDAVEQMEAIRTTVNTSATAVKGLGRRSQEIGQIVEVITGIADQTNLLALNAAIEAARAGEQGRGFAVVAEEVRKLAEQSRTATGQIAGLIQEIQQETAAAVSKMESGTNEVAQGSEVISATGTAFEEIAATIQTVVDQIYEVNTATSQLSHGSQQVVRAVESVASVAQEAAAGTEEISAGAQQQSASVEEIAASAESLAELAQGLMDAVSSFSL